VASYLLEEGIWWEKVFSFWGAVDIHLPTWWKVDDGWMLIFRRGYS
jgi:hypothetical protein